MYRILFAPFIGVFDFLTASRENSAICGQIRECVGLILLLCRRLFLPALRACLTDRKCRDLLSEHMIVCTPHAFWRLVCMFGHVVFVFGVRALSVRWSLSPCLHLRFECTVSWIPPSSSQGCILGVSASLTHSHMLFPNIVFRLARVVHTSHSIRSLSLRSLCLSCFHLCFLDADQLLSFFLCKAKFARRETHFSPLFTVVPCTFALFTV